MGIGEKILSMNTYCDLPWPVWLWVVMCIGLGYLKIFKRYPRDVSSIRVSTDAPETTAISPNATSEIGVRKSDSWAGKHLYHTAIIVMCICAFVVIWAAIFFVPLILFHRH